jgi:hypothetical protein
MALSTVISVQLVSEKCAKTFFDLNCCPHSFSIDVLQKFTNSTKTQIPVSYPGFHFVRAISHPRQWAGFWLLELGPLPCALDLLHFKDEEEERWHAVVAMGRVNEAQRASAPQVGIPSHWV